MRQRITVVVAQLGSVMDSREKAAVREGFGYVQI